MDPRTRIEDADLSLDGAARCHICFQAPKRTYAPCVCPSGSDKIDVILTCPLGCGNIALGHTTLEAVTLWNVFIEYRMREAHQLQASAANPATHSVLSPCKQCLQHTRSILRTEGHQIIEQCAGCKLTKSMKEVD